MEDIQIITLSKIKLFKMFLLYTYLEAMVFLLNGCGVADNVNSNSKEFTEKIVVYNDASSSDELNSMTINTTNIKIQEKKMQDNNILQKIRNKEKIPISIWMWEANEIHKNNIIQELSDLGIDVVYLNAGYEKDVKGNYIETYPKEYNEFIKEAEKYNIKVQALFGTPEWTDTTYYNDLKEHVKLIFKYNKKYKNKFDAIHLDIEPHLYDKDMNELPDWGEHEEIRADYLKMYYENLNNISKLIKLYNQKFNDDLKLVLDIPVWFKDETFIVKDKNIIELLIEIADELVIMNYTNNQSYFKAWGMDNLMVTDEYNEKLSHKTRVTIAMEYQPDETMISLYYLSSEELNLYIQNSILEFKLYQSFHGLAIHDYKSYITYLSSK